MVIVNWNTRGYLERCLSALSDHRGQFSLEVWVVDNASTDDSVAYLQQHHPYVKLIHNSENVGFSRANNQAIRQSLSEFVLLLNSDAFLLDGALDRLMSVLRQHPKTGVVGAQLLYEDRRLQRSCYSFPDLATELWQTLWLDRVFPKSTIFGKYLMTYWEMNDLREVDWLMGACVMIRKQALNEVGLFDESFFMYSEETDLCYRMHEGDWEILYVPEAQCIHIWGGSSRQLKKETLVRLYQSRVKFFRKHYGAVPASLLKLLLRINSLLRSVGGALAYIFSRENSLLEKTRSYWHLFRAVGAF